MRLCILETDTNSDPDLRDHGTMPEQFQTWLGPALPEARWSSVAVYNGAALPDPVDHDAYLITGSRYGVYDALPWMAPLSDFIGALRMAQIPLAGICFGHQIMAQAYGAVVEKSAQGWVLGAEVYNGKAAFAMHQDQVQTVPSGARSVTASERCKIARVAYDFPALSVQYHPEFTAGFMQTLLDLYEAELDPDSVARARASLTQQLHVERIAEEFATFFRAYT